MDLVRELPFSSLAGALRYRAAETPNKVALLYPDPVKQSTEYTVLTFRQYDNVTNRLAQKIDEYLTIARSTEETLTCAILATGGIEYLLCQYALLKLQNVVMFPISSRNSQPATEHLLRETKTVLLITTKLFLPLIENIRQKDEFQSLIVLCIDQDFHVEHFLAEKDRAIDTEHFTHLVPMKIPNDDEINRTVVILHSSGSTAYPKPIYLSNRYFMVSTFQYLSIDENFWKDDDIILCWGALFHLLAFNATTRALFKGFGYALPLCVSFPPKPDELVRNVESKNGITVLATVPSLLEQVIRELLSEKYRHIGLEPLKRLRFITYGGSGCPDDLCRILVDNGIVLSSIYGSTETGISMIKKLSPYDGRWKIMQVAPIRLPYVRFESPKDSQNSEEKLLVHLANDPFLAENLPLSENGCYVVGDIFVEDPPQSGQYYILGRQDDILVHLNGEKTNPMPMEDSIRRCPIVKQAVIVGHLQFNTAAIIELNHKMCHDYTTEEIEKIIWNAVDEANQPAPSHSAILRSLIHILPDGQTIPITHKGNLMRRNINQQYSALISEMYSRFFNEQSKQQTVKIFKDWTFEMIRDSIKEKVKMFNKNFDTSTSLFDFGINSLQVVELRHWICQEICEVGLSFLYEHSSIDRMSHALVVCLACKKNGEQMNISSTDRFHYQLTEDILENFIESMVKENFTVHEQKTRSKADRIFLVTGANGYLGNYLIRDLLATDRSQVKTVYCLLRGSNPKERLLESLKERNFDVSFFEHLIDDRLIILPTCADLNAAQFGQTSEIYQQLEKEVTDIIHCAWKVNFNQTIQDFQHDTLLGHFNLLKFAMLNQKQFHFVSSIASASSGLVDIVKEEPLPRNAEVALPQGYGQSKYIAEHLCWAAMNIWKVPVSVYRVGQISGDTQNGTWNTTELAPMMIYAGAGKLKKMPDIGRDIYWIPIDICSRSIVDLALNVASCDISTGHDSRVYHLMNPRQLSYNDYLECLRLVGLEFDIVKPKEFLDVLLTEANASNPLVRLSSFLEQMYQQQEPNQSPKKPTVFETIETQKLCQILAQCPAIDSKLIGLYIDFWRRCQIF